MLLPSFIALGFALARIATHVVLHRVSIRTLDELLFEELGAGWGSVAVQQRQTGTLRSDGLVG